jgi:hypothetical protein
LVPLFCGVWDELSPDTPSRTCSIDQIVEYLCTKGRWHKRTRKVEDEASAEYHRCGISERGTVKSHMMSSRLGTQMGKTHADGCRTGSLFWKNMMFTVFIAEQR